VLIIGPTTGVVELIAEDIRVDDESVAQCPKGVKCSFITPELVRRNDKVYRVISAEPKLT